MQQNGTYTFFKILILPNSSNFINKWYHLTLKILLFIFRKTICQVFTSKKSQNVSIYSFGKIPLFHERHGFFRWRLSWSNCSPALCARSFMFAHHPAKQTHISYCVFCAVGVGADSGFGHIIKLYWRQWLGLQSSYGRTVVGGSLCVWGLIHLHGNPSIQISNERPPLHSRQAAPRSVFWSYVTFNDISPTACWLHTLSTLHVPKGGNGKRGCWEVRGPEHSVPMSQDLKRHAFQSHHDAKVMVLLLKQGLPMKLHRHRCASHWTVWYVVHKHSQLASAVLGWCW